MIELIKFALKQKSISKKIFYLIFSIYFILFENQNLNKKNTNLGQPSDDQIYPLF